MKTKIKNLTADNLRAICKKYYNDKKCSEECPLYRYRINENGKKIAQFCHGYLYTFYLSALEEIETRENITEEEKIFLKASLIKDNLPTLEKEIEL